MNIELLTKKDLHDFKDEILSHISQMLNGKSEKKEWLKSTEVREMLKISAGTLQHLRVSGVLPYTKIGGSIFYEYADVLKVLNNNKKNSIG